MNLKSLHKFLLLITLSFCIQAISQNGHQGKYLKYIDSASNTIDENPKIAVRYLDSIPEPLSENVKGHLACYYELRVLINNDNNEESKQFQNTVLALKYAELEKNYDLAGWASLELFYSSYIVKKDTGSYKYLDKAKTFYKLSNNKKGFAEVTQMEALDAQKNHDYKRSNEIILNHLDDYKRIEDDVYYHMYALFLLTENHIYLDSLQTAHKHFKALKALKDFSNKTPLNHVNHLATIYGELGRFHFEKKAIDSTFFYLSKSEGVKSAMNDNDKRNFYNLYIDYFKYKKDYESKNKYIDSLRIFEEQVLKKTMDASLLIGNKLMESESELSLARNQKRKNKLWIIVLFIVLIVVSTFYILKYRRSKKTASDFEKSNEEYSYLKSSHEKLKVKVHGLEDYISDIKKEIKTISSNGESPEQRKKIKELYKNLHLNASVLLDKNEDHLKLVNELNIDFFTRIKNKYPQLNDSEILICYYMFAGFKSKEMAVFLKTTTRAIEGRRYRIRKKLYLQDNQLTLQEFLDQEFNS
ncbi:hypothetical protein [Algibacter sp. 2305UL17-15]|uniref:helix-turn-helix transcriptional regulator n=1 Tax=Algibacter sp. 2305UL17-15 TaxID=3231268 RepID=UPI003458E24B